MTMSVPEVEYFNPWAFIDAMRDAGYTPQRLSDETGISLDAIARWMAGTAAPKTGYATLAAQKFGVNVDDFYEPEN